MSLELRPNCTSKPSVVRAIAWYITVPVDVPGESM
jgi:hypothetical protein